LPPGNGCVKNPTAISKSSSGDSALITPAFLKALSQISLEPAIAPEWDSIASAAAVVLPGFSAITGFF